jgi:hypothetical protein
MGNKIVCVNLAWDYVDGIEIIVIGVTGIWESRKVCPNPDSGCPLHVDQ